MPMGLHAIKAGAMIQAYYCIPFLPLGQCSHFVFYHFERFILFCHRVFKIEVPQVRSLSVKICDELKPQTGSLPRSLVGEKD